MCVSSKIKVVLISPFHVDDKFKAKSIAKLRFTVTETFVKKMNCDTVQFPSFQHSCLYFNVSQCPTNTVVNHVFQLTTFSFPGDV